jgi:hypothetical protein
VSAPPTLPELFARAVELSQAARERLLAELGAEDPALAGRLRRMLAADGAPNLLDRPPWAAGEAGSDGSNALPPRIGPYRIERELGRGGMGRVFLAEQRGADFSRRVALKVVAPGAAGPSLERRFREERRILAALEHPGIARFYDAGRADDGTWYLALEFVEGEDLLAFVRRANLDARGCVELFLQVLDAVDFAHRRLIVHRDLKPGNVLVGGDGRAKLLDFGISKILEDEEESPATRTELRALTPAYASPEQVRGERATIAADVYSLGVVLYEMLAGGRPPPAASPPVEPAAPSSARRELARETAAAAGSRGWRELRGDLDAIVLKALRSEPEGRYRSAAAFAEDLRRWIDGRPVEARRGGRRYRLGKLVVRHRLALAASAAVLLALASGLSLAIVQRSRALAAQAQAEATVRDLHRLSQSMLFEIYQQVKVLPGSLEASSTIVRRATEVLDRLSATAGDDPQMLRDLAAGYEQLGAMYGSHPAMGRSLDRPRFAVEVLTRARDLRGRVAALPAAAFADRLAAAESFVPLARALARSGQAGESKASTEAGVERLRRLEVDSPDRGYLRYRLAVAHTSASRDLGSLAAEHPETDPHFAAAAGLWRELVGAPPAAALTDLRFQGDVAAGSLVLLRGGYPEEALRLCDLGLEAAARHPPPGLDAAALVERRVALLSNRIGALGELGRSAEELASLREIVSLRGDQPLDPDNLLADLIGRLGNYQRAAELGAELGDLEFATAALAEAERLLATAEQAYGAASFVGARMEIERSRATVLLARAERTANPAARRRLLGEALAIYRSALARVEGPRAALALHGTPPERIVELRRQVVELEARLR